MSSGTDWDTLEALWQKVLAAALLGTERQPFAPPQAEGALGALLSQLDPSNPEGALLSAVTALAYMRRAGRLPLAPFGRALPPPCPPDSQPVAPEPVAALLKNLANFPELMGEWLRLVFARGWHAPELYIPELLNQSESVEPVLGALVAGVRGRWLAALMGGKWTYAAFQLDDDSAWRTGAPVTRRTYLGALRLSDPERARQLLEATWARESAEQRVALLGALSYKLSEADLPFLNAVAQTDRALSVRERAADLIERLLQRPSALAERERAALKLFKLARAWQPEEFELLMRCDHDWSAAFSARFAESLSRFLPAQMSLYGARQVTSDVPARFEQAFRCLHPQAIARAEAELKALEAPSNLSRYIWRWQAILHLRAKLHEAL